jgi:hypothetical protein
VIGSAYVEMAAAFWDEFILDEDSFSACEKVIEHVSDHEDDSLTLWGQVSTASRASITIQGMYALIQI